MRVKEFTRSICRKLQLELDEYDRIKSKLGRGLGGRLSRQLRGAKSVRAFARECLVSPTYISLIENGKAPASPAFLRRLLRKFFSAT